MALDLTGTALANLMAAAGLGPPALPANPTAAQIAAYNSAIQAQAQAYSIILTYIANHAAVSVTVPATGILDHSGGTCTGTASGTGTLS